MVGRQSIEAYYCVTCSRKQPGFRSLFDFAKEEEPDKDDRNVMQILRGGLHTKVCLVTSEILYHCLPKEGKSQRKKEQTYETDCVVCGETFTTNKATEQPLARSFALL